MKGPRYDVVVVGSGAGGAPVAHTLARAGASVLVLEKGPRLARKDFLHDEISSCRRDLFVPFPEDDPHTLRRSPEARAHPTNAGWISRCVGGGTVHMSGFFFRFHPEDFRIRSNFPDLRGTTVEDWPFGYETLEPYYDRVEREVGVSGAIGRNPEEPPRQGDYPFPPVATHPIAELIDERLEARGLHPFPVPRAIITRPMPKTGAAAESTRQPCHYCALCGSYGCEVGAKSSTAEALLPAAERAGAQIESGAMVYEIPVDSRGRAHGVRWVDAEGRRRETAAEHVVVAASALESARLLLLSRSRRFPHGLGNDRDQVGRNLTFNTLTKAQVFLRAENIPSPYGARLFDTAPFVGRALQDFRRLPADGASFGRGGTLNFLWAHPNPIYAAEPLIRSGERLVWGEELMERLEDRFVGGRMLEVEGYSDWLPTAEGRVDLDPQVTDAWGLPAARITVERHPSDAATSARLARHATDALAEFGEHPSVTDVGGETWVLQGGTCRMGQNPDTSVTNGTGRIHGVPNVWVSDGGALPTSGGVPCTETILANAFRVADHLRDAAG